MDKTLRAWWPTTRSMDLVEATIAHAADSVSATMSRIAESKPISKTWHSVADLNAAFELVEHFDNVASTIILLPTASKWTVMWNNSFLCDGFDMFCRYLTTHHHLTTLHWHASDQWTTFQSGSMFHYRMYSPSALVERRVQAAQSDNRWHLFEQGEPLAEEDIEGYKVRRKRDRLNEVRTMELLRRLGADPWNEAFYSLPGKVCMISRPVPETALIRRREDVLKARVE